MFGNISPIGLFELFFNTFNRTLPSNIDLYINPIFDTVFPRLSSITLDLYPNLIVLFKD